MPNARKSIIKYAKNAIGCSYDDRPSYGIEGESYNCSFLTFCAYRYAGLKIPTWQGHQNGNGSQSDWVRCNGNLVTDPKLLKAGDLVFFSSCADIENTYHVGISLGGYRIIDSMPNVGVQERHLYDTFVGGGWPLPIEREKETQEMQGIISITDRNTFVYYNGDEIQDISEPEDLEVLQKVATAFTGKPLNVIELAENEYALLCRIVRAGMPVHLSDLNEEYPPRG